VPRVRGDLLHPGRGQLGQPTIEDALQRGHRVEGGVHVVADHAVRERGPGGEPVLWPDCSPKACSASSCSRSPPASPAKEATSGSRARWR
jgi:hypothetical protein